MSSPAPLLFLLSATLGLSIHDIPMAFFGGALVQYISSFLVHFLGVTDCLVA